MATLTPNVEEKVRALRRMKLIATGAFVVMVAIFVVTEPLGRQEIVWLIRWDHVNAFAEAAMVGALADWFAVVALFRHPLGIPIWHTAIIPRKKEEIGRNLGNFVETRLLSVENLSREIGRFSASKAMLGYLSSHEHRRRAAGWVGEAIGATVRALDDEQVERMLGEMVGNRLRALDAAPLLGRGLDLLVTSGRIEALVDGLLHQIAGWLPSHRGMVQEFIERSLERTLKWGSRLVPNAVVERATDQTLGALIDVIEEAARDPRHPLRQDLERRVLEWSDRLRNDPEWIAKVEEWKLDLIEHEGVRSSIGKVWGSAKEWILRDVESEESLIASYALRGIESLRLRLESDAALAESLDERLRSSVIALLGNNHSAIGNLIQRIVDSWDAQQLSRELELNLGRDLQYIRLNGTFIGGLVGLVIHLFR